MSTSDTTNTHGTPPFDSPTLRPADSDSADELGWSDASSLASLNDYDSVDESNDSPGTAAPEDRQAYPPGPNEASDQAVCRICLESASSGAAGESLGRLLSPCKCKGTMKYVHASCLDTWRAASLRSSSAVACDQCGAPLPLPQVQVHRHSHFAHAALPRQPLPLSDAHMDGGCSRHSRHGPLRQTSHHLQD